MATSCEELTHWKRLWCWEGLGAGGEGDDRGWDGWMVSLTRWTWIWVNSGSWWWTGRPGVLRFMGSQSRTRLSDWSEVLLKHKHFGNSPLFVRKKNRPSDNLVHYSMSIYSFSKCSLLACNVPSEALWGDRWLAAALAWYSQGRKKSVYYRDTSKYWWASSVMLLNFCLAFLFLHMCARKNKEEYHRALVKPKQFHNNRFPG